MEHGHYRHSGDSIKTNASLCPPGIAARDIGMNPEYVPASKWGAYQDGIHELRAHLGKRLPLVQKWRGRDLCARSPLQ